MYIIFPFPEVPIQNIFTVSCIQFESFYPFAPTVDRLASLSVLAGTTSLTKIFSLKVSQTSIEAKAKFTKTVAAYQ